MLTLLHILLLLWLGVPVLYFTVFSVASAFKKPETAAPGEGSRSFVVLIPAYKSDSCILETARAAAAQDYPEGCFRVIVISDSMLAQTVDELKKLPVEVLEVSFENSTKAKSLKAAMDSLGPDAADAVVILDADNIVAPDFLKALDGAFRPGLALQAHRTAKNRDTAVAVIDAVSEEINNSIFRRGHNALGVSSALIGSGMAFDYRWFRESVSSFTTAGEDKEMELKLLRDGIRVEYLDGVKVLDEKTRTQGNYYNQRRRWTASQYHLLRSAVKGISGAKDKTGYADKLLQWTFPPRMLILAAVPLLAILYTVLRSGFACWWWALTALLVLSLVIAVPEEQRDRKLLASLVKVPVLAVMSAANLFRMKGTRDKFVHTEHN